MANVLALGFDGTIVENHLHAEIYDHFAPAEREAGFSAFAAGEISAEEFHAQTIDLIEADEAEIRDFALAHAIPRPGLVDLVNWAEGDGWMPAVLSSGFDFVIGAVLKELGLTHLVRHAGRARKHYRWRVKYLSPRGIELASGFQQSYVRAFQSVGDFVAFGGSAISDREAAVAADAAFVRGDLTSQAQGTSFRSYPFETFFDVKEAMQRESEGWSRSTSPPITEVEQKGE